MGFLGFSFASKREKALSMVSSGRGGWMPIIRESFAGAWQKNIEIKQDLVLSHHADFACRTLIASDIAKLRVKLVQKDRDGVWNEIEKAEFSENLRKPNHYQNRIQFFESWVLSKLQNGNTYVLKNKNIRGAVIGLYVLDPYRIQPLISDAGDVYYQINSDDLNLIESQITVPASEIIHDRFNTCFHPLIGLSPIFASGLAAMQGLAIQNDSTAFFKNGAQPGGILTAPGAISDDTAKRLKDYWDSNFTGRNAGKIAVMGDGLKYEAMRAKAVDSQLIEQLRWTAEVVCGVYHVPAFMAGVGAEPNYNNVQNLTLRYYSQCLQRLIEDIEACLDDGLGMDGVTIGTEFDVDSLLRMDAMTQMDVLEKSKGKMTVNEQRLRLNLKPVEGGDTVYLQDQDHSIEWLARRDSQPIVVEPPPQPLPAPQDAEDTVADDEMESADKGLFMRALLRKELGLSL